MTTQRLNRLAREKSPYLLQHAQNPVDWFAWGEKAFARARAENKPIFLSIGYSTCHWCHVMERESFENQTVADFLNEHFVSIKVDREERPDVDKIYMTFVQATTGSGGWPLNLFLTAQLKPIFGGTYFPPDNRHGRGSFLDVLRQIQIIWDQRPGDVSTASEEIEARLQALTATSAGSNVILTSEVIRNAGEGIKESYDPRFGGFGPAPKFPHPSQPIFLLGYAKRFQDAEATAMVLHTCDRMAAGGIHDQLGGGFARYSVDAQWLVPHFEKMLYDNAQLAQLYLDAFLVSGEQRHAQTARDILAYVLGVMTHPDGGFYSAEDADSEGHEGKFYCWTRDELENILAPDEFQAAARYFGITREGNFSDHSHPTPLQGQNVLSVVNPTLAPSEMGLLASAKAKMSRARASRIRPHLDDKILTSWNGLMLGAFSRAYAVLGDQAYRVAAEKNLKFIQTHLWSPSIEPGVQDIGSPLSILRPAGALHHRWRDGQSDDIELLEDYAFLLPGLLELYEAALQPAHLDFAIQLAGIMIARFYDADNGGFWQSGAKAGDLILRVKDDYDGAQPSGNSAAVAALLKLAAITGRDDFKKPAEATLRLYAERMQETPMAVSLLLQALDFWIEEPRRVVIAGAPDDPETIELLRAAHSIYQPNKIVLGNSGSVDPFARTLPAKKRPAAYLCSGSSCQPPTSDPAELKRMLAN